jgi:hypothetical protein
MNQKNPKTATKVRIVRLITRLIGRSRWVRSVASAPRGLLPGLSGQLEGAEDDVAAAVDADQARHGDRADAHRTHELAEDVPRAEAVERGQLVERALDGHALAEHADHRHQHVPAQERAADDDQGVAQADDVAQAHDRRLGHHVELEADLPGQVLAPLEGGGREGLAPGAEGLRDELVPGRDQTALDQDAGLAAARLARHQDLGRGRGLGEREFPVHVLDEVAAERDQEQDPQEAAQQRGQAHLQEVGLLVQAQDVDARQGEDRTGDDHARGRADRLDHHVLLQGLLLAEPGADADGQDRDRDRGLEDLADLQAEVGGRGREERRVEQTPDQRVRGQFGHDLAGRNDGRVILAWLQLAIGVLGQALGAAGDVHGNLREGR